MAAHKHVVCLSGGLGSWACGKRVAERHGTDHLTLLFADTLIEDEDLYRFLAEAVPNIGGQYVRIAHGRTPWEVFYDVGFLGNTRIDPCSRVLKRELLDRWLAENCDPANTTVYIGIDWTEEHRFTRLAARKAEQGWRYAAPLCEAPYLTRKQMLAALRDEMIEPPRLYRMGFAHNNCGGFCVKAGHGAFKKLLQQLPQRYADHEFEELVFRFAHGHQHTILRDRRGGRTRPMTMEEFRLRVESGGAVDEFDIGGCGCAVDDGVDDDPWGGL
jgi:hypothetical protein